MQHSYMPQGCHSMLSLTSQPTCEIPPWGRIHCSVLYVQFRTQSPSSGQTSCLVIDFPRPPFLFHAERQNRSNQQHLRCKRSDKTNKLLNFCQGNGNRPLYSEQEHSMLICPKHVRANFKGSQSLRTQVRKTKMLPTEQKRRGTVNTLLPYCRFHLSAGDGQWTQMPASALLVAKKIALVPTGRDRPQAITWGLMGGEEGLMERGERQLYYCMLLPSRRLPSTELLCTAQQNISILQPGKGFT